jgi:hypothetical protein
MPLPRSPLPRDEQGRFAQRTTQLESPTEHNSTQAAAPQAEDVNLREKVDSLEDSIVQLRDMMHMLITQQTKKEQRTRTPSPTLNHPLVSRLQKTPSPTNSATSSQSTASVSSAIKQLGMAVPNYVGDVSKPQALFEYIHKLESYFRVAELPPLMEVLVAASKFTHTADLWWRTCNIEADAGASKLPKTWHELKQALIKYFTPAEHATTIRLKIHQLKQHGSIVNYNNAFNQLVMQVPTMSQDDRKFLYLQGLQKPIYSAVVTNAENMDTLATLQLAAIRQEQLQLTAERTPVLRAKSVAVEVNATASTTKQPRGTASTRRGRGGQDRNYSRRMPRSPCFICNEAGHWARDCPKISQLRIQNNTTQNAPAQSSNAQNADKQYEANLVLSTQRAASHSIAIDSCATDHMVKDKFLFEDFRAITPVPVVVASNDQLTATGVGTVTIHNNEDVTKSVKLNNVLYVPGLSRNLCSTHPLTAAGLHVRFAKGSSAICRDDEDIIPIIYNNRLPFLDGHTMTTPAAYSTELAGKHTTATSSNYGTSASGMSAKMHLRRPQKRTTYSRRPQMRTASSRSPQVRTADLRSPQTKSPKTLKPSAPQPNGQQTYAQAVTTGRSTGSPSTTSIRCPQRSLSNGSIPTFSRWTPRR